MGRRKVKRKISRSLSLYGAIVLIVFSIIANWFVRHDLDWINAQYNCLPSLLVNALIYTGEPFADITDSLGFTGRDAALKVDDTSKIGGKIFFAGPPIRKSSKAPDNIKIDDKGTFILGYSDKLRHCVWSAYKVNKEIKYNIPKRPAFKKDKKFKSCPSSASYAKTGYDRGHMTPNYAIMSRYGEEAQHKTFLMSNIVPQTPELNRGVWREIEHRIADSFTSKWGEVWVIVGALSNGNETLSGTNIDVPTSFYQVIATKSENEIRVLAFLCDQNIPWNTWPRHYLISIDELEERTGFDFFSELEDSYEEKLESQTPTRLLPTDFITAFKALAVHFNKFD